MPGVGSSGSQERRRCRRRRGASATSTASPRYKAYYTDLNGQVLGDEVGDGTLPAAAWGVKVDADRSFDTFFIRVVGINDLKASTTATAVAGYVENAGAGNVLPIIFPLNIIYCLNNGNFETQATEVDLADRHARDTAPVQG